jgi:hypothetical protein
MSASRLLWTAVASITLISAVWIQSAQVATPDDDRTSDVADGSPFKPVASVSSLMAGIGSAFGTLSDVFPQSEEDHRLGAIATWSEVIAELSNVNTRHGRKPAYVEMAADTRSIALELARAARADTPDEVQLTMLFANLDTSCGTCHNAD